ncbi:MAG: hypothetical protein ACRYG7_27180 [Janthinobacterium lividum]
MNTLEIGWLRASQRHCRIGTYRPTPTYFGNSGPSLRDFGSGRRAALPLNGLPVSSCIHSLR